MTFDEPQRIAVVGAGIAGLSVAWMLSQRHRVTLFEAEDYLGGHTRTVDVDVAGQTLPIGTGFLVYNNDAYPNLTALFEHLEVPSIETDLSFAVSLDNPAIEWASSSLARLFGQTGNLVRPGFWRMLSDIERFKRESLGWLADRAPDDGTPLAEFLEAGNYSTAFRDWYLLPLAAAVWSCPAGRMIDYPVSALARFCRNHGLLHMFGRQRWRSVAGGGRAYVEKLAAGIGEIRLQTPVKRIHRTSPLILVATRDGVSSFDHVVLACHSDQALVLLDQAVRDEERVWLSAISYQAKHAVLHTDTTLLPRTRRLWSAWNCCAASLPDEDASVSVSYLVNRLQNFPVGTPPLIVTLNPTREPEPHTVLGEYRYSHPVLDRPAMQAQARLGRLQGEGRVWFCGAWSGHGFHEDGLRSAMAVAEEFGCRAPWLADGTLADEAHLVPA